MGSGDRGAEPGSDCPARRRAPRKLAAGLLVRETASVSRRRRPQNHPGARAKWVRTPGPGTGPAAALCGVPDWLLLPTRTSASSGRRKQKWAVDPQNTAWSNDDSKFGQRMLEKMGWSKGKVFPIFHTRYRLPLIQARNLRVTLGSSALLPPAPQSSFFCSLPHPSRHSSAASRTPVVILLQPPAAPVVILLQPPAPQSSFFCSLPHPSRHSSAASRTPVVILLQPPAPQSSFFCSLPHPSRHSSPASRSPSRHSSAASRTPVVILLQPPAPQSSFFCSLPHPSRHSSAASHTPVVILLQPPAPQSSLLQPLAPQSSLLHAGQSPASATVIT
nr:PIN2/TERF1-interacting telomerase inhibitor 1 isoform X4 [Pan troglodytes]